jgi:2'-5' RNA ligase
MPETVRSFIAFDLDDKSVLRRIQEVQNLLIDTGADLKLVTTQNMHVTFRFLGNVSFETTERIYEEMKKISFTSFDLELRGLGTFPSSDYVRILWVGVEKGKDELKNVFIQLESRLQRLGFKSDYKGFSPHITIARVRTGQRKTELLLCVKELEDFEFGSIKADCLRLKKSVLTPKGPVYSTIYEIEASES